MHLTSDIKFKKLVAIGGPGDAIPMPVDDEAWRHQDEQVKYVPLQAREGDIALFLPGRATEVPIPLSLSALEPSIPHGRKFQS
jgi:hypothetical protein